MCTWVVVGGCKINKGVNVIIILKYGPTVLDSKNTVHIKSSQTFELQGVKLETTIPAKNEFTGESEVEFIDIFKNVVTISPSSYTISPIGYEGNIIIVLELSEHPESNIDVYINNTIVPNAAMI